MAMYAMSVWTEGGNSHDVFPYYSDSKEKLFEKYKQCLRENYEDSGMDDVQTIEEYAESAYYADMFSIYEIRLV